MDQYNLFDGEPRKDAPPARPQFNLFAGEDLKEHGIERACWTRGMLLDQAREIAFDIARSRGEVTYDDVYVEMLKRDLHPENMGNAAGSVFRDRSTFSFTGRWSKSARITNHARVNRVWTLSR
jgi:hypothetical protein